MDKKALVDKLFAMKAKDENLSGQLKRLKTDIQAGLVEAATLSDPDVTITDVLLEIYHTNRAKLPTISPYADLVVKVAAAELAAEEYHLEGQEIIFVVPPKGIVTVSYYHAGTQAEIDKVLAFFPDLLSSELYYERMAYWQAVLAALENF